MNTLTPWEALLRFAARAQARDESPTIFTVRGRDGTLQAWIAARAPHRLAKRYPGRKIRRERLPGDDRRAHREYPEAQERLL